MLRAANTGNRRRYIAAMLEKVQMPPGELFEIVGLAQCSANRTGVLAPPLSGHRVPPRFMLLI